MKKLALLLAAVALVVVTVALPAAAAKADKTVKADSPIKAKGKLKGGGKFKGKLKDAAITVDPATDTATVEGTLVGEATQDDGEVVPVQEPIEETVSLESTTCPILTLTIEGLFLDLLGLQLIITELDLTLQGETGDGKLLGNILCSLTDAA
jgi:hypothetical protein